MRLDPETFDQIVLTPRPEKCKACGYISRFEKRDYHFEDPAAVVTS
jgi:hypothetical protein